MPGAQHGSSFCSVGQLVVPEAFSVTDGVCWPWTTLLIHQREKQTGIKTAAQKYPHRHIAKQVALDCIAIQLE